MTTCLVPAHVRGAHEDGEDEVHEEVEGDEGDEEVVRLHRQLRLVQLHREEDGDDADDLRGVADEPVDPVEEGAAPVVGVAARQGDQRLHEAQAGADDAQQGVRVLGDRDLGPALDRVDKLILERGLVTVVIRLLNNVICDLLGVVAHVVFNVV